MYDKLYIDICVELRRLNWSMRDIAKLLNVPRKTVARWCKRNNLGGAIAEHKNQHTSKGVEVQKQEAIDKYLKGKSWEYFGGFTNVDSGAQFRCLKCGAVQTLSFISFRQNKRSSDPRCKNCICIEKEKIKTLLQNNKRKVLKPMRQMSYGVYFCKQCGCSFLSDKKTSYCSDRCRKTYCNWLTDHRINKDIVMDKDITLTKLYKKHQGVCYLCKQQCEWEDKTTIDGVIICGNKYPSIDHVIPLSKGGKHAWKNVKLACRGCNMKKGNRLYPPPL